MERVLASPANMHHATFARTAHVSANSKGHARKGNRKQQVASTSPRHEARYGKPISGQLPVPRRQPGGRGGGGVVGRGGRFTGTTYPTLSRYSQNSRVLGSEHSLARYARRNILRCTTNTRPLSAARLYVRGHAEHVWGGYLSHCLRI